MAYQAPNNNNTYIASTRASDGMSVAFFRNPESFPINRYGEIRDVTQSAGKYLRIAPDQAGRVRYTDLRDNVWRDGAPSPTGNTNQLAFEFENFSTTRYAEAVDTGRKAIEQADWAVEDANAAKLGQWLMTARTTLAESALANTSWGNNTAAVDGTILASGQNWTNGTGINSSGVMSPNIQTSLLYGAKQIWLATYGFVTAQDLILRLTVPTAIAIALSPEVRYVFSQTNAGTALVAGDDEERARIANNALFGIPPRLYGFRVEVENAVYNTARPGATPAPAFVNNGNTAYLLARPGEMQKPNQDEDTKAFQQVVSTLVCFTYEDVSIEFKDDAWDRIMKARATTDVQYQVSSPLSGFQFTSCIS